MPDLEISDEAVQIVADHCFGEVKPMGELAACEIAAAALDDAARLVVADELRRMANIAEAQLREAEAELERATPGMPDYRLAYARAAGIRFHRDELLRRADELEEGHR